MSQLTKPAGAAIEYSEVPVRVWHKERGFQHTAQYKRVLHLIGRAIEAGGQVTCNIRETGNGYRDGRAYDVLSARIVMPPGVPLPGRARGNRAARKPRGH